jgi:copper chaperone CopZ
MNKLNLFLASALLAAACSGPASTDSTITASRTETTVNITDGVPMATADMSISGMSCEMMCGSMIKGALVKVPGVEKADVTFHDGDAIGHAKVTYDPAKVNDADLAKTVQALADGQYKVEQIAVVKQVKGAPAAEAKATAEPDNGAHALMPEVEMPNLVGLLMALARI